jgi:hypothetical protein
MSDFDELNKMIAGNIQSFASSDLAQEGSINTDEFVIDALDVFRQPAELYATGSVTQAEFEELVDMGARKVELELVTTQALPNVQVGAIGAHMAKIVTQTASDFLVKEGLVNVDADEPWPRR